MKDIPNKKFEELLKEILTEDDLLLYKFANNSDIKKSMVKNKCEQCKEVCQCSCKDRNF